MARPSDHPNRSDPQMPRPGGVSVRADKQGSTLPLTSREDPLSFPKSITAEQATIRVAIRLRREEVRALQEVLEQLFRRPLQIGIEISPDILGGVWVRVGDIVIDGSLRGRLDALRHHLRTQCRVIISARPQGTRPKVTVR